jgi:hypothetical protein
MGVLRNNVDQWGPRFNEETMVLLANLCLVDGNAKEMLDKY